LSLFLRTDIIIADNYWFVKSFFENFQSIFSTNILYRYTIKTHCYKSPNFIIFI